MTCSCCSVRSVPRLLLSVSWTSPWAWTGLPRVHGHDIQLYVRRSDWQVAGWRKWMRASLDAWQTFVRAKRYDAVIVSTTSLDAVLLSVLMLTRPKQCLAVYDFLLPKSGRVRRMARWPLRRVNIWLVIRRGDADTFHEELGARTCRFVPFPAHHNDATVTAEECFVYAAGTAYRDWPTLIAAATMFNIPTVISASEAVSVPDRSPVTVIPLQTPAEGRATVARAAVVCLPMLDTKMPSGPLVVLDALAAGKAVVASDVNGTRDYLADGAGVLVPPGDPDALGAALRGLLDDEPQRQAQGGRARQAAAAYSPAAVLEQLCLSTILRSSNRE